ncbi:heparan sulfate glucosamine 3-O-sulfotransferase 5-like [Octopus vulgaris]|uniref:Heparan sulfate glucosamine 3-O-sulfotransferase 5-like n=1 Tax=Octopus vulgaris TaxID=6645 RepID=A0AA36B956_OCTVU|nr:heparan sulfate glucosamine 3-O-sulfotransferase 5-like [Octopus vulgaris]
MNILPTRTNPLGHSFPQSIYRRLLQEQSERKNHSGNLLQRNPNCIIIGVRKCGTRALLEFLSIHPNIQISKSEMHFFNKEHNYKKGLEWYRKEMPYTYEDEITIEKTPAYFITKKVPERIYKMNQTIKLLIIFRDPTIRVISDYTQVCHNRMAENKTCFQFKDLVMNPMISKVDTDYRAVDTSIYCKHLLRWLRLFPIEQMHFVDGDILLHNPLHELRKVETFLKLEHKFTADNFYFNSTRGFYCMRNTTTERCLSSGKGRRHAKVDPHILDNLRTFFQPYNKRLFKMINHVCVYRCVFFLHGTLYLWLRKRLRKELFNCRLELALRLTGTHNSSTGNNLEYPQTTSVPTDLYVKEETS